MPRTEAGKRLLDDLLVDLPYERDNLNRAIDAIEAEARERGIEEAKATIDDAVKWDREAFKVVVRKLERERIRTAVEGLGPLARVPFNRAAVLAIIDERATPAAEGQITMSDVAPES